MNLFYPRLRLAQLPTMLAYAAAGGLLGGLYGVVHDQVTYSISSEYFTHFKFVQFRYADFGFPARVFVGEIGFLATWWVGFIAGWFIARLAVRRMSPADALRHSARAFVIVASFALAACLLGYAMGLLHGPDFSAWEPYTARLGVTDVRGFVRVAYIHNAGYAGGLVGLVAALLYIRSRRSAPTPQSGPPDPEL